MKKIGIVSVLVFLAILAFFERGQVRDLIYRLQQPALPSAQPRSTETPQESAVPVATPRPSPAGLPEAINLDVPFTSQAPHKIWDYDHEEFCEEASALMAVSYLKGDHSITNPDVADQQLYAIKEWEMTTFGYFADTTTAETARILTDKFDVSAVRLIHVPTLFQIKTALSQGKVVLVPAAGRLLPNPNFKSPGPLYHMIVLKGYTRDGMFITNDPGTRLGADFLYTYDAVMNAMHDWNDGDVLNGEKIVIIVG
jgi:peptidase C39-like protein